MRPAGLTENEVHLMKRTERHHLKENELAHLAAVTQRLATDKQRPLTAIIIGVVVVIAAAVAYGAWQRSTERQAQAGLVEASVVAEGRVGPPPAAGQPAAGPSFATERERHEAALAKFQAVADGFPSTDAGVMARYRAAASLMALGRPAEAVAAYQRVIDDGRGVLAEMGRLGLATAQAEAGQYDAAIATYRSLAERRDGPFAADGVLIQLARTYRSAGRMDEARQTYTRVIDEFPTSLFSAEARRELEQLNTT
jgi:tetratricopeptide (TPR) repeat protein